MVAQLTKAGANVAKRVMEVIESKKTVGQFQLHETGAVGIPTKSTSMKKTVGDMIDSGLLVLQEKKNGLTFVLLGSLMDRDNLDETKGGRAVPDKGKSRTRKKSERKAAHKPVEPEKPKALVKFKKSVVTALRKAIDAHEGPSGGKKLCLCGCGGEILTKANFIVGHDARLAGFFSRYIKGKVLVSELERALAVADHPVIQASKKFGPLAKQTLKLRKGGAKAWNEA